MLEFYKALDKMEVEIMPEISGEGAAAPLPGAAPAVKEEAKGLLATWNPNPNPNPNLNRNPNPNQVCSPRRMLPLRTPPPV